MEDLNQQIGHRIRDWRHSKSLTQEALADSSGLHRAHLGEIERGELDVSVASLRKIAAGLGTSLSGLLWGIGGKPPRSTATVVVNRNIIIMQPKA